MNPRATFTADAKWKLYFTSTALLPMIFQQDFVMQLKDRCSSKMHHLYNDNHEVEKSPDWSSLVEFLVVSVAPKKAVITSKGRTLRLPLNNPVLKAERSPMCQVETNK